MRTGAVGAKRALRNAAEKLARAAVPEPTASAEVLLSELLGIGRAELTLHDEPLTSEQAVRYEAWISRRSMREPVQRILGYAYFRDLRLDLNRETLIPRPDTESVVDAALERIDRCGGSCRVLDIGTGSGAIAVSIAHERPLCEVYATDTSEAALRTARQNAERAGVRISLHLADIASGLDFLENGLDVLVSNPPYVRSGEIPRLAPEVRDWDPHQALDGGPDGLAYYRRIFAEAPSLLSDGADVVLEVGDGQADAVLELGSRAGFVPRGSQTDLAGTPRVVLLRRER
ncbi:MAG TPA: peptide chain release factor N(5)-glutamine methyltransferase [Rubrobacteraceae bacterium]|nr:peptide chain release factor N(5)-glutamine methyltransferase [Rubrobacteraceae bacterium]